MKIEKNEGICDPIVKELFVKRGYQVDSKMKNEKNKNEKTIISCVLYHKNKNENTITTISFELYHMIQKKNSLYKCFNELLGVCKIVD
jgi:hypothetical protein